MTITITAYTDVRSPYTFVAQGRGLPVGGGLRGHRRLVALCGAARGSVRSPPRAATTAPATQDQVHVHERAPGRRRPGPDHSRHEADLRPDPRPRRSSAGQGRRGLPSLPRPGVRAGLSPRAGPGRPGARARGTRRGRRRCRVLVPAPRERPRRARCESTVAPRRRVSSGSRASSSTASCSGGPIPLRRSAGGCRNARRLTPASLDPRSPVAGLPAPPESASPANRSRGRPSKSPLVAGSWSEMRAGTQAPAAFASRRRRCRIHSVYPFGCSRPVSTRSSAAWYSMLASRSGAMGR